MKFTVIAGALAAAACLATTSASAQHQGDDVAYEMAALDVSELRTGEFSAFVPVPTPRPAAAAEETVLAPQAALAEIRRTADGIRIVGPRFFPED